MLNVDNILNSLTEGLSPKDFDRAFIIRRIRQRAKITCRELGAVLGMAVSEISDMEHGRKPVSEDMAITWALACTVHRMADICKREER